MKPSQGGGRATKNARWSSGLGSWERYMDWEFTDPAGGAWAPQLPSYRRNLSPLSSGTLLYPPVLSPGLCPIGNGLCQPDIYTLSSWMFISVSWYTKKLIVIKSGFQNFIDLRPRFALQYDQIGIAASNIIKLCFLQYISICCHMSYLTYLGETKTRAHRDCQEEPSFLSREFLYT